MNICFNKIPKELIQAVLLILVFIFLRSQWRTVYTQTVNLTGTMNAQISHRHAAGWVPAVPLDRNVIWSPWAHPCQLLCRYRCICFLTPRFHSSTLPAQTLCLTACLACGKAVHGNEILSSHGPSFTKDRLLKLGVCFPWDALVAAYGFCWPEMLLGLKGHCWKGKRVQAGKPTAGASSSFRRLLSSPLLHTQSLHFLADAHLFPYLMWEITVMFQGTSLRGV